MPRIYLTSAAAVAAVDRAKAKAVALPQNAPASAKASARWHGVIPPVAASVGPGRVFSIMRCPPDWLRERIVGQVLAFTPTMELFGRAYESRQVVEGKRKARRHTQHCLTRQKHGDGECECGAAVLRFAEYARRLLEVWPRPARVAPGVLQFGRELTEQQAAGLRAAGEVTEGGPRVAEWDRSLWHGPLGQVEDGDTLVCTCGLHAQCHRIAGALRLHEAGWDVVLDGNELDEVHRGFAWVQVNEDTLARGGSGWHKTPDGVAVHVNAGDGKGGAR